MMEFTLVFIAVIAVMSMKWETASRWRMGVGGFLSMALGLCVMALVTATYLVPCCPNRLWADEPAKAEPAEAAVPAPAEPAVPAKADSPPTTGEKPVEVPNQAEVPSQAEVPKQVEVPAQAEDPKQAEAPIQPEVPSQSEANAPADAGPANADLSKQTTAPLAELPEARPAVPIITKVTYLTPNRPSWVESGPTYEGELLKVAVRAGPYPTVRACEPELEEEVRRTVADFTNDYLRAPHAATFIRYSLKDLRTRKVVREQFSEQLETSLGMMNQVHAQLVFDDQFRDELDQRWSEIKSKSRLAQTGLGTGIVLLFLGTMFSFLKLDTATKGYYTGRLQFSAAATILALVAASVLLMKWIPWM